MSGNLEKFHNFGKKIEYYLRPNTFPIAIKFIKDKKEIPKNSKSPSKDLGMKNFLCQNFKMVRTYGWTMIITAEDCVCKVARTVYGWDTINEETVKFANLFNTGLYSKDIQTAEKWLRNLYIINKEIYGIVISPLTRTKIKPDIVQIYCNPAQAMRLIQAYLYYKGGTLNFTAAGRAGSCHEGVIKTYLTNKPQLVILGNGDRVWGGAEDSEIMFSIPKNELDLIVQALDQTHQAGLRYPIPKYMNYKPGFQTKFSKKAIRRAGGTVISESPSSQK